ncbi:hypothetical protein ONZ51_g2496 [Trametes cubensis]|uniref:Queuosine 5'-phosphate N-glycosylase/hydrolase n=1 Tax=Trametes cubensis TaxID=1111947 RepID=A0AAD7U1U8_9APHY|nr:hypothetical protein ONZ51_g2496 [Trametes cubensis]
MTVTIISPSPEHQDHHGSLELNGASKKRSAPAPRESLPDGVNPVLETSKWAMKANLVGINEAGVATAAKYVHDQMQRESYTPRTWRTHPLHLCPEEPFSWAHPSTRACLDWIFLISSLNFSFWSELEGQSGRYGVEWREGWGSERRVVHTGYWSLVAAVDRALEEGIPITDPTFYASESRCPDSLVEHVFRRAPQSVESIPLLRERIAILRENGAILCERFGGSFYGFVEAFRARYAGRGTALQLVKMVTDTFPSFRDEVSYNGRRVYLWKRAQILVAETWAGFYPPSAEESHPLFPSGDAIHELTMFADYRVPQILHHLRILSYSPSLVKLLRSHTPLAPGSAEELSIRSASIVAVERVRQVILDLVSRAGSDETSVDCAGDYREDSVSSVLIDFYLWDLAKRAEGSANGVDGVDTVPMLPIHRTRSIWY